MSLHYWSRPPSLNEKRGHGQTTAHLENIVNDNNNTGGYSARDKVHQVAILCLIRQRPIEQPCRILRRGIDR
jgi:hypothetical protein